MNPHYYLNCLLHAFLNICQRYSALFIPITCISAGLHTVLLLGFLMVVLAMSFVYLFVVYLMTLSLTHNYIVTNNQLIVNNN
jgi:hypothetical protein